MAIKTIVSDRLSTGERDSPMAFKAVVPFPLCIAKRWAFRLRLADSPFHFQSRLRLQLIG
jgi:hypothetical protein